MFRPNVYLHYKRVGIGMVMEEITIPVEYPKELTEIGEIFEYGYIYDKQNPVKGFRLSRVTVKSFAWRRG